MKSKYIPANLELGKRAIDLIRDEIKALNQLTSTRKKRSLNDEINKERLQYLLFMGQINEDQMARFGVLLDPKNFNNQVDTQTLLLKKHKKDDLVKLLAETQLKLVIERGYGEVLSRSLDYLWHKFDGTEYRRVKQSFRRQKSREELFAEDNQHLKECLEKVKKRIKKSEKRSLISTDYRAFRAEVYLNYPKSLFKHEPRLTGEYKDLTPEQKKLERKLLKEDQEGWSETRLREFFEKNTGVKPSSRKCSAS